MSQSVAVIAEGIRGGERDVGEGEIGGGIWRKRIKEESGRRQKACNSWTGANEEMVGKLGTLQRK